MDKTKSWKSPTDAECTDVDQTTGGRCGKAAAADSN